MVEITLSADMLTGNYKNSKPNSVHNYFHNSLLTEIIIEQWTCPPHHGKGECDSKGAVIKKEAKWYLLLGKYIFFMHS